jgi:dephospho-CoA kinase
MLRVVLTGGIATGKSFVLRELQTYGVPVLEADTLAREAISAGTPGFEEVVRRFGREILGPDGEVDRRKLGALVFSDESARRELESIVHPQVRDRIEKWFQELAEASASEFGMVEIPLVYETGRENLFDYVVAVACDEEEQLRRLLARSGMDEKGARARLASQLPVAEKARRAHFVVWTGETYEATRRQVAEIYRELQIRARSRG